MLDVRGYLTAPASVRHSDLRHRPLLDEYRRRDKLNLSIVAGDS